MSSNANINTEERIALDAAELAVHMANEEWISFATSEPWYARIWETRGDRVLLLQSLTITTWLFCLTGYIVWKYADTLDPAFTVTVVVAAFMLSLSSMLATISSIRYRQDEWTRRLSEAEQDELTRLDQMLGTIAHEFRTPLASAKGHTQLLREQLDGTLFAPKAERVVSEFVRLEKVTDGLLDFVRSGRVVIEEVVILPMVQSAITRSGVPVTWDYDAPDTWNLDPRATERILINLFRNAQQATPVGGKPPHIIVVARKGELFLKVFDFGVGFDKNIDPFAPFSTTRSSGTGLGLNAAKQVIEAHDGEIRIGTWDFGSVVQVSFPKASSSKPVRMPTDPEGMRRVVSDRTLFDR